MPYTCIAALIIQNHVQMINDCRLMLAQPNQSWSVWLIHQRINLKMLIDMLIKSREGGTGTQEDTTPKGRTYRIMRISYFSKLVIL